MKIVLVSTFDMIGGASIAALRLHKGLRLMQQDSWMLVKQKDSQDPYIRQIDLMTKEIEIEEKIFRFIEEKNFNGNRTEISNTSFSLPYPGYDLSEADIVQNADIINLHWVSVFQSVESVAVLLELGKPVVWTLHDQNPFSGGCHYSAGCLSYRKDCRDCPQLLKNDLQLPAKILETKKKYWQRNLTIVTPSHWLAECAKQSSVFRKFRIEVIPNSLETDVFVAGDKAMAKKALGLDSEKIVLLFSAYSDKEKRKGFAKLMEALRHCLKQPRFWDLAASGVIQIINLGPSQSGLEEQGFNVCNLGIVSSHENLATVYAAADILVMPSLEENLSNVMLEALACATPVLGFAVGGTPDVVQNGVNGFLAPAYAADKFADLLLELIFNRTLREQMGRNGRSLMEEKFSLRDQAANYLELFFDLSKGIGISTAVPRDDDSVPEKIMPGAKQNVVQDYLFTPYRETVLSQNNGSDEPLMLPEIKCDNTAWNDHDYRRIIQHQNHGLMQLEKDLNNKNNRITELEKEKDNLILEHEDMISRFYAGYTYRLGNALLWPVKKILGKLK